MGHFEGKNELSSFRKLSQILDNVKLKTKFFGLGYENELNTLFNGSFSTLRVLCVLEPKKFFSFKIEFTPLYWPKTRIL